MTTTHQHNALEDLSADEQKQVTGGLWGHTSMGMVEPAVFHMNPFPSAGGVGAGRHDKTEVLPENQYDLLNGDQLRYVITQMLR